MDYFLPLPNSLSKAREIESKFYFLGKPCAQGHLCRRYTKNRQCVDCSAKRSSEWRSKNPGAAEKATKKWRDANKDHVLSVRIAYRKNNSEKIKAYKSMRYFLNIDESRQKERNRYPKRKESNKRCREENKRKPEWFAAQFMRNNIHRMLNDKGRRRSEDLVGYKRDDLIKHLESIMEPWMTWENYGLLWEIDHIVPIDYFLKNGIDCPKIVNALENLRPLCRTENKRKSNKLERKQ